MKHVPRLRTLAAAVMVLAAGGLPGGCSPQWQVRKIARIDGFSTPECAVVAPWTGRVYVSNIVIAPTGDNSRYNTTDGTGFISRLDPGGKVDRMRWAEANDAAQLHSAKGLCILGDMLYVADIDRVRRIAIRTGKVLKPIVIPGAKFLNDVATDGRYVWVSDTTTGKIHRIDGQTHTAIPGPGSANGIALADGKMFVASWLLHEIYQVDPTGKTAPVPFGLADKFGGLDGIVILPDGAFLVSDQKNGKIHLVSPDRKTVRTLLEVNGPADFAVDLARGLLYIPLLHDNALGVYRLSKQ